MNANRLLTILLLFCASFAHGAVETFSERLEGAAIQSAITTGVPFTVYDDKFYDMVGTGWMGQFTNYNVKQAVRLGINPEVLQTDNLSGTLQVNIKVWKWSSGAFVTSNVTRTLSVSYNTNGTVVIDDINTYFSTGAHKMEITVISNTGLDLNDVYISGEIEVERYYNYSGLAITGASYLPNPVVAASDYIEFKWPMQQGAEYYELEWVHVNNYTAISGTFLGVDLDFNYYLNSTRVTIKTPYYRIPKLFDQGYIVFRVRGIGMQGTDFKHRKEGAWSAPESGKILADHPAAQRILIDTDMDVLMNWSHQVGYTEDGKRFEGISYVDGLGRERQSLTHNTETQQVLVSNTYYDSYGRAVVSDLPTPLETESMLHNMHFNLADVTPTPVGFGTEHYLTQEGQCLGLGVGFHTSKGAGKYYSSANPDKIGENAMIPDAQKYPFSRIEYMKDHTGRLKRAGAYGPEFALGSGHETKFMYATPSQEELDLLFGSEAGYFTHYQKRITTDANGQAYLEYFDMSGRVVASGYAGTSPVALDPLENNSTDPNYLVTYPGVEGQNPISNPTSIVLNYGDYISNAAEYKFNYSLNPGNFKDLSCTGNLCFDCVYKFSISVKNDCGIEVYSFSNNINGSNYDALCNGQATYTMPEKLWNLVPGDYNITKVLEVDQAAIDKYWCTYLESSACAPNFYDIFSQLYKHSDFDNCVAENVLMESDPKDPCSAGYMMMLNDLSPGGQYGEYAQSGGTMTATSPISVLNTSNALGAGKNWRASAITYLNDNGSPSLIEVVSVGGGAYLPALVPGAVVTPLTSGHFTTKPQNLLNLSDFVWHYEQHERWAEALLPFHPEYCYYEFCSSAGNAASHAHDNAMSQVTSYSVACSTGYFNPLNIGAITNSEYIDGCDGVSVTDPFFASGGAGYTYAVAMKNKMNNFITIGGVQLTIWKYAILLATCPEANTAAEITACMSEKVGCYSDLAYIIFVQLYKQTKDAFYHQAEDAVVGCDNTCIGSANSSAPCASTPGSYFNNAVPRWGLYTQAVVNNTGMPSDPQANADAISAQVCQSGCEAYADEWMASLQGCPFVGDDYDNLRADLIAICAYGCNNNHPQVASSLPAVISPSTFTLPSGINVSGGASFNTVMEAYFGSGFENDLCSELLISEPLPYQESMVPNGSYLDNCGCDKLAENYFQFTTGILPAGVTTLEQLIAFNLGIELPDAESMLCKCRDALRHDWEPGYEWGSTEISAILAHQIIVPKELTCDRCVTCGEVNHILHDLDTRFDDVANFDQTSNYLTIRTNYLNRELGFHLTEQDYNAFIEGCNATPSSPSCELTEEIVELKEVLNLLAHQNRLVSETPFDIANENVVYSVSPLREFFHSDSYWTTYDDITMILHFGSSCDIVLEFPGAEITYSQIIGFGNIIPVGNVCGDNHGFYLEAFYLDCGVIKTQLVDCYSDCFPVQTCICGDGGQLLCDKTVQEQMASDEPCYEPTLSQIYQQTEELYYEQVADLRIQFGVNYNSACAAAFNTEKFTRKGPYTVYQFTLFYYDQAGNLSKTVAPSGVVAPTNLPAVITSRNNTTGFDAQAAAPATTVLPAHNYKTLYSYNAYNQPVSTNNPDQEGATQYWYDYYGRIIASQNPVQADELKYSYTLYDPQGRPVESGQACRTNGVVVPVFTDAIIKIDDLGAAFQAWVNSCKRTEVTVTTYDKSLSAAIAMKFFTGVQQNLRLRVATIAYYETIYTGIHMPTGFTSAQHYSYDIHGNVIETVQDVPMLASVALDVKTTQYEFELVSGNVKKVTYQQQNTDEMVHYYSYDKLGRLSETHTSTDNGIHKSRDAKYRYYDYGPLARVEIGQYQVQGLDYAYTLNGWMKGMNSNSLRPLHDGGKDGIGDCALPNMALHREFGRDVVGYTLGYYSGDYKGIGDPGFEAKVYTTPTANPLSSAISNLYNGNIAHLVTSIDGFAPQATVYKYDQLQRLKGMRVFRSTDVISANNWQNALETNEYKNNYTYDLNGNIKTLLRNSTTALGIEMDKLDYKYTTVLSQPSNRLFYVDEAGVNDGTNSGDIKDMSTGNFGYDKIGEMTSDVSEGIATVEWFRGSKKVKRITRAVSKPSADEIEFIYNPMGQRIIKITKPRSAGVVQPNTTWKYTFYTYDANGQVMALYETLLNSASQDVFLKELDIYGAGRIGLITQNKLIYSLGTVPGLSLDGRINKLGQKNYEITNYLGNVNAVVTDRKTAVVAQMPTITDNVGISVAGSVITKTAASGSWNAGGASVQKVEQGGYVEWTLGGSLLSENHDISVGLSYINTNVNYTTINNAWYTNASNGNSYVYELGTLSVSYGAYALGTVFRIQRENCMINYYMNGILKRSVTDPQPQATMLADFSMKVNNTKISSLKISSHAKYEAVVVSKSDYYPFGMQMPAKIDPVSGNTIGGNWNSTAYRYGYNGMEKDDNMKGAGNSYTTEFRQYDPRLGRWLSLDPMMAGFPTMSPYCAFNNNPIYYIDPLGLKGGPGPVPKVIGHTLGKVIHLTSKQIEDNLSSLKVDGLSLEYLKALVGEEGLTLKMYDMDNQKSELVKPSGRGGNTTIGIGHLIHYGAIGATQYDSKAIEKEAPYKNGLTIGQVFELFSQDLSVRLDYIDKRLEDKGIDKLESGVKEVFMDIYFNSGGNNLTRAMNVYKNSGIQGLYDAIQTNDKNTKNKQRVTSVSNSRKNLRLNLLKDSLGDQKLYRSGELEDVTVQGEKNEKGFRPKTSQEIPELEITKPSLSN